MKTRYTVYFTDCAGYTTAATYNTREELNLALRNFAEINEEDCGIAVYVHYKKNALSKWKTEKAGYFEDR